MLNDKVSAYPNRAKKVAFPRVTTDYAQKHRKRLIEAGHRSLDGWTTARRLPSGSQERSG